MVVCHVELLEGTTIEGSRNVGVVSLEYLDGRG